jgi:hypothetical protein
METSLLDRLFVWISPGFSQKPNDPPGKPAGFVWNNDLRGEGWAYCW